ncbi:hypothetical protein JHL21_08670 [Devosia sp. WQ 349]|uniref:hypothetical protein n=1 Tax=Devosia sp. WQ 349K1 TaxID=2800329 RepID=UPI001904B70D|nr:hypothetical protein [Devosia sp. WQ 349K1]MBK1794577.1 hypothetical protein [Devosia sp. WQ 349K1]
MRVALLAALLLSSANVPLAYAEDTHSVWRAFVADSASANVSVIDLESDNTIATYKLAAPATLYAAKGGHAVFAVQGKANQVQAISTGLTVEDHGDHADLKLGDPALLAPQAEGQKPAHFVEHDGKLAIFFDESGKVQLSDATLWQKGTYESVELDSGKPHHGVAVPFSGGAIVTKPVSEDGKLPSGFNVFDASGDIVGTTELCADVHGEASSGDVIAFGCSDGVLIANGAKPDFTLLPFTDLPEGRVGTLLAGKNLDYFLGNYGPKHVAIIEPEAETPIRLVSLPDTRVHFVLNGENSRFAYLLLADGSVQELDSVRGELLRKAKVTEPYATDGGHGTPMPRLGYAGDDLLVTDPATGKIHKLDLKSFAVTGSIDLGGAPSSIAVVGGVTADH